MKRLLVTVLVVLAWLCVAANAADEEKVVQLKNVKGEDVGTAKLVQIGDTAIEVTLDVKNLPPGLHGAHIHQNPSCAPPDFTSAGGHFNPESKKHGMNNPEGYHAGDLYNFRVDEDGTAHAVLITDKANMGAGPNSVFGNGGTSLIIHAGEDDLKTDPSGNSGARIACGIITK